MRVGIELQFLGICDDHLFPASYIVLMSLRKDEQLSTVVDPGLFRAPNHIG